MKKKNQKIVRLEAQNLMRLRAVEIKPSGEVVVIGGRNAQGKSSVLNSIAMALGGGAEVPGEPVRSGEEEGHVVVELDEVVITRRFGPGKGSKLEVRNRDGAKLGTPQKILDSMMGSLSKMRMAFDPLAFCRADPRAQAEALRTVTGLDTAELDARREDVYAERTGVNREVKRLKGALDTSPMHEDVPDQEVSLSDLLDERATSERTNLTNKQDRKDLAHHERAFEALLEQLEEARKKVRLLEDSVAVAEEKLEKERGWVEQLQDQDVEEIGEQIRDAEAVNRKVRENKARKDLEDELAVVTGRSDALSQELSDIDEEKKKLVAACALPVNGLTFGVDGVRFGGVPFDQASQSEQLRVAVAVGLAANPELRVLLVRDGSLLDADGVALLAKLAAENDAQLWVERVGEGSECTVVIEDGAVKG